VTCKHVCEQFGQFGPAYDVESATLKKFRSRGGDRKAYGEAVLAAVRSAQRSALNRATPSMPRPNCASGTTHQTGRAILKAVAARHAAALEACPSQERRARKPEQWRRMYDEAMAEKRARETAPLAVAA
jgi:hypothetical protein